MERSVRDTTANSIRAVRNFVESERFANRYNIEIRTRLNHLNAAWSAFLENHHQLEQAALNNNDNDAVQEHQQVFAEIEEIYLDCQARLEQRLEPNEADNQSDDGSSDEERGNEQIDEHLQERNAANEDENNQGRGMIEPIPQPQQVQMPQLPPGQVQNSQAQYLPIYIKNQQKENTWGEFNGDVLKWQAFRDCFKDDVHEDASLGPAQKFRLLRKALKGTAYLAISGWQPTGNNYQEAWERLNELFDRPYHQSSELLKKFFKLEKIEQASGGALQKLCNITHEVIRQLKVLGHPVQHYDSIFVHALHERLDPEMSREWELRRDSEMPKIADMLTFLDRQAKASFGVKSSERKEKKENRKRPFHGKDKGEVDSKRAKSGSEQEQKSDAKNGKPNCTLCNKEPHRLFKCGSFLKMSLEERKKYAREQKICFNCLLPNHSAKECTFGDCNRCENQKHNSTLCHENPKNKAKVNTVQTKKDRKKEKKEKKEESS